MISQAFLNIGGSFANYIYGCCWAKTTEIARHIAKILFSLYNLINAHKVLKINLHMCTNFFALFGMNSDSIKVLKLSI